MADRAEDDTRVLPRGSCGDAGPPPEELAAGTLVGEYRVRQALAIGGCGTVYAAEHRVLGRPAAVKILHRELAASPEMVERFVREARAVNLVNHPNIVDIYDFGELGGRQPYFVMELLEGQNLEKLIDERGRLPPEDVLEILEPICLALGAAHAVGVVHRDLKASNVFLASGRGRRKVKLLDFGIAKLVDPQAGDGLTSAGSRLGTPYAMAPEQIRGGTITPRADIYALGVLVFHMVTGSHPFESEDAAELERMHLSAPAPRPSARVPSSPALDAIVLRCL